MPGALEEIEAGLTRRREAREDEQAAIPPNVEEHSTVVVAAAFNLPRDLCVSGGNSNRRARKTGKRFGENDAWQMAFAERAHAAVVGRDRKAFLHLGARYEQFDRFSTSP